MSDCTIQGLREADGCPANVSLKQIHWAQLQMLCSLSDWMSGEAIDACDFAALLEEGRCSPASITELEYWKSLKLCEVVTGLGSAFGDGILQGDGSGAPSSLLGTAGFYPAWSATAPFLTPTSLTRDDGYNLNIGGNILSQLAATPNADLVIAGPYDVATAGAANLGPTTGQTSFEMIGYAHSYRVRQAGTVARVKLYMASLTGLSAVYVKIWRKDGTTYDLIGTSANILSSLTAASISTVTVSIPLVQEGDFIGLRLEYTAASVQNLHAKTVASATTYSVLNATPTTTNYAWESQTATATSIVPIEVHMTAPVMVVIGDSIAAGHGFTTTTEHYSFIETTDRTNVENSFPWQVANNLGWTYQNMGIGGQKIADIQARFTADVINLKPKYALIHIGRNDITGSTTQAQFVAAYITLLDAAIAAGIRPIVSHMIGGTDLTDANSAFLDAYNAALDAVLVASYPTAIRINTKTYVNTLRAGVLPADNLYNFLPGFSDDTIHPTPIGYRRMAEGLTAGINRINVQGSLTAGDLNIRGNLTQTDGQIKAGSGLAYNPSYSFKDDLLSGWFQNATSEVNLSLAGVRRWDFTTVGMMAASHNVSDIGGSGVNSPRSIYAGTKMQTGAGSAAAPSYTFNGSTTTGIFLNAADAPSIAIAGIRRWDFVGAHLKAAANNVSDIGAAGTDSPRTIYAATSVVAPQVYASSSLTIGGGAPILKVLTATLSMDFDLTAVTQQDITVNVPGAAVGDVVALGIPAASTGADWFFPSPWVSSAGVVTVRAVRMAGTTPDPAVGTFRVMVTQF